MALLKSKWLHSLHEGHEGGLKYYQNRPSWILFTEEVGHDPLDKSGKDFREWTDQGFWPVVRINNGYEPNGTIPSRKFYDHFIARVKNYVANSQGPVYYWIIGNEPNLRVERPQGEVISAADYGECFIRCRKAIKSLPGHSGDVVMPAPIGPWNMESGHWMGYFRQVMVLVQGQCDGIALHTYTHGHSGDLITSEEKMSPPNEKYHYQFRAYRDFMAAIPQSMRSLPVLITEATQVSSGGGDQNGWLDQATGWIYRAYQEIHEWNRDAKNQTIQGLVMYRFPNRDAWVMDGKANVLKDFMAAAATPFESPEPRTFPPSSTPQLPSRIEPEKGIVLADMLNVRNAPGLYTQVVGKRYKDDPVNIFEKQMVDGQEWYRIGDDLWAAAKWIESNPIPPPFLSDWQRSRAFTARWEGDYTEAPWDPGNWTGSRAGEGKLLGTKYGISGHSYPNLNIKNLTREEADEIYYRDYWLPSGADKLPWPECLYVFDTAINFGVARAKQWWSESGGKRDVFLARRLKAYRQSAAWPQAGNAWVDRVVQMVEEGNR